MDMLFFDANVRESLKFSISKVDEAARIHHFEEVKEKMSEKCKLFGKDIVNSPLKSGIKQKGRVHEALDPFGMFGRTNKSKKE